ncbi:MAG: transglycosylase SLT domain-containing protein [Betaproteobacteria bacterium]
MQQRTVLLQFLLLPICFVAHSVHASDTQFAMLSQETPALESPGSNIQQALDVLELPSAPTISGSIDLTAATDDLWLRLRNGFSMQGLNNELVLQQQLWYQSHPEHLRRVIERSRRYMHYIIEALEKRGMPTELALLPMVESSFNPMAYSRAHASGLWQFIPSTGKRYDLQQNWWHDQRRDIVASTNAALDYLQAVYEMHGDWHLALASYNWGEGAVKRAIQKNAAKGLPTDYSSLNMPSETRQYVPKLIALKNIFSSPALVAELKLPSIENRPYFVTIEPNKPIDVKVAAKLAEMSVDEFVALNPSHNRPVIRPAAPLVIPADKKEVFQANLESRDAPLCSWQIYTLKPGEKLDKVAPRFGITLADLKRVNGLHGKLRVSAGSSLLVPAKSGVSTEEFPEEVKLPEIVPERGKPGKRLAHKAGKGTKVAAKGKGGKGKGARVARGSGAKKAVAKKTGTSKVSRRGSGKRVG